MRTTTKPRSPITEPATVTSITSRRPGRPPAPRLFITEEIREGALVAKFRSDIGMTQEELAYRASDSDYKLARSTLAQYEKGRKRMPDQRIEMIADALGIEPWFIRIIQTLPLEGLRTA